MATLGGEEELWQLKDDLKVPAIYNDGEMSLRIKCFVSGEMWLSGKDCDACREVMTGSCK